MDSNGESGNQWPGNTSTLEYLGIASNSLTGSDALSRLQHFSNLKEIQLRHNSLTELNGFEKIKNDFPKLTKIGLSGNKFTCDKLKLTVDSLLDQKVDMHMRGTRGCRR